MWDRCGVSLHVLGVESPRPGQMLTCCHRSRALIAPGELRPVTSSVIFGHLSSRHLVNARLSHVSSRAAVVWQIFLT